MRLKAKAGEPGRGYPGDRTAAIATQHDRIKHRNATWHTSCMSSSIALIIHTRHDMMIANTQGSRMMSKRDWTVIVCNMLLDAVIGLMIAYAWLVWSAFRMLCAAGVVYVLCMLWHSHIFG